MSNPALSVFARPLPLPMSERPRRLRYLFEDLGYSETGPFIFSKGPLTVEVRPVWDGIELHNMQVDPDHRGQGIASSAIEDLLRASRVFNLPIVVPEKHLNESFQKRLIRSGFSVLGNGIWAMERVPDLPKAIEPPAPEERKSRRVAQFVFTALSVIMVLGMLAQGL